ncbi:hypothetical protein NDU88_003605 [Pleurodeles waltl]|uniref:Uncharacterized protein n=1 Tax=Pleurodeles waltl TaxID=8319 RepID=A0AAV7PDB4_PLEWA|nr:hypothetical protein NDU88_003605 [Pleurodeles waltl]
MEGYHCVARDIGLETQEPILGSPQPWTRRKIDETLGAKDYSLTQCGGHRHLESMDDPCGTSQLLQGPPLSGRQHNGRSVIGPGLEQGGNHRQTGPSVPPGQTAQVTKTQVGLAPHGLDMEKSRAKQVDMQVEAPGLAHSLWEM